MSTARPKPPTEKNLRNAFAKVIEQCRTERGMSQEGLAEAADLSVSYVSLLERGQRNLTVFSAAKIAVAIGMRVSEMVVMVEGELKR